MRGEGEKKEEREKEEGRVKGNVVNKEMSRRGRESILVETVDVGIEANGNVLNAHLRLCLMCRKFEVELHQMPIEEGGREVETGGGGGGAGKEKEE